MTCRRHLTCVFSSTSTKMTHDRTNLMVPAPMHCASTLSYMGHPLWGRCARLCPIPEAVWSQVRSRCSAAIKATRVEHHFRPRHNLCLLRLQVDKWMRWQQDHRRPYLFRQNNNSNLLHPFHVRLIFATRRRVTSTPGIDTGHLEHSIGALYSRNIFRCLTVDTTHGRVRIQRRN